VAFHGNRHLLIVYAAEDRRYRQPDAFRGVFRF
jgi:hypothetical protein